MSRILCSLPILLLVATALGKDAEMAPGEILLRADEVRNPKLDYTVTVTVRSIKPNRPERISEYEVLIKGKGKTLIKTLSPATDRGTSILMIGKDLWTYLPNVAQPVRISLQQRLTGDVSIGDIARVNLSGDYAAKLKRQTDVFYALTLVAKNDAATYHKVDYAVQKGNFRPMRANFFVESGKLLKSADYQNYRELAGQIRPGKIVMTDAWVKGQKSIITYDSMKVADIPDKYFTKDYLKKLKY